MKRILTLVFCTLFLCSCGEEKKEEPAVVQPVTCAEMKELQKDGAILIDVRTSAEYKAESIDGAINITVDDIGNAIPSMFENKDTKIIVYCRSGNRSATAAQTLIDLGYKNVYDLGGINNCAE